MEKRPFFTIGMLVYNTEKWLSESLDSVLNQNFSDFEIICLNDGSVDGSLKLLNNYAAKDNRVKIISRTNGGASTARNAIMTHAQGQYLYFLDSDDIMCENTLQNAYDAISSSDFPQILHTNYIISSYGNITEKKFLYPGDEYFSPELSKQERFLKLWLDNKFASTASAKFVSVDFLRTTGLFFPVRYIASEDREFALYLMQRFDSIAYGNFNSFCYFHPREGSATSNISYRALCGIIYQWTDFYKDVLNWNISEEHRKKVLENKMVFVSTYRDFIFSLFNKSRSKEEIFKCISLIESHIGNDMKKLPHLSGFNGLITHAFRIIGITPACRLLYSYLKLKNIVN